MHKNGESNMQKLFIILAFLSCNQWGYAQDVIGPLYGDVTGFGISTEEKELIKKVGGAPTYGEIVPKSISILLKDLQLTEKDVFYDLGSGVGKIPVQVYLQSPVQKSVGVELSPTRHARAMIIYEKLKKSKKLQPHKQLLFKREDMLETPIDDATVVLLCSTCFSDALMDGLLKKIQVLKPGTRVLTLQKFKQSSPLKFIKTYNLPMTWSESSPVYLYEVV